MSNNKFPIKPDSVLHRMLKLIAEEAAKELCAVSSAQATGAKSCKKRSQKRRRNTPPK